MKVRDVILSTHKVYNKSEVTPEFLNRLVIPNPAFGRREDVPMTIQLYKEIDGRIYVPRNIQTAPGVYNIIDKRIEGSKVCFPKERIILRPDQIPAVDALVRNEDGILHASCGKGKTVMALKAISYVGRPALILVHKEFLLTQWLKQIKALLGVEAGVVQGDTWNWQGRPVVVGMLQTLYARRDELPDGFLNHFGVVVSDEVHRVSAPTWSQVIESFPAKRRWGLSATLKRADRMEVIFLSHIGKPVFELLGTNLKPIVQPIITGTPIALGQFENRNGRLNTARLTTYLTMVEGRNRQILKLLINAAEAGRRILLLTDRVEHAKALKQWFDFNTKEAFESRLYIGGLEAWQRTEAEENADVLFATTQMAKEALDIPSLDTLFLVSPQASEITTEQAVGRIARTADDKKTPLVLDFVDEKCNYTANLFYKRCKIYEKLGLEIRRATSGIRPKGNDQANRTESVGDQPRPDNNRWFNQGTRQN